MRQVPHFERLHLSFASAEIRLLRVIPRPSIVVHLLVDFGVHATFPKLHFLFFFFLEHNYIIFPMSAIDSTARIGKRQLRHCRFMFHFDLNWKMRRPFPCFQLYNPERVMGGCIGQRLRTKANLNMRCNDMPGPFVSKARRIGSGCSGISSTGKQTPISFPNHMGY
jgi:hypothetical protein